MHTNFHHQQIKKPLPIILTTLLVLIVMVTGVVPRFWSLSQRGVYYYDEALFLRNSRFWAGMLKYSLSSFLSGSSFKAGFDEQALDLLKDGGEPILHARPFHEIGLTAASFLFGDYDRTSLYVSALAGFLTLITLMLLFRLPSSPYAGLFAAFFLALSVWHTHYSRSGLTQAVSLLMVCISFGALVQYQHNEHKTRRALLLTAFLAGIAFTTHYNLFWLPVLVGIWLVWIEWRNRVSIRSWLYRMTLAAIAMVFPPLMIEAFFRIVMPATATLAHINTIRFPTYFSQIIQQLGWTPRISEFAADPTYILKFIAQVEGLPFVILLLAGFAFLLFRAWRKDLIALLLLSWTLAPLLIWTFFGFPAPRSFVPLLPPLLIGAGWFVETLGRRIRVDQRTYRAFIGIMIVFSIWLAADQAIRLWPVMQARSPWKIAAQHIITYQSKHGKAAILSGTISRYASQTMTYYLNRNTKPIKAGNLFMVDATTYLHPDLTPTIQTLEQQCQPILEIPDDNLENGMLMEDAFQPVLLGDFLTRYRQGNIPHRLAVYDLKACGNR